jgi:hypothetical protein
MRDIAILCLLGLRKVTALWRFLYPKNGIQWFAVNALRLLLPAIVIAAPLSVLAEDPAPQHVAWMKEMDAINAKINRGENLEANARRMGELMKNVAAFWIPRDAPSGRMASEASTAALDLANRQGDLRDNKMSITASCKRCHLAHRKGPQGGVFKIK